jgi:ABC-type amino acid transport substrate-binding protein
MVAADPRSSGCPVSWIVDGTRLPNIAERCGMRVERNEGTRAGSKVTAILLCSLAGIAVLSSPGLASGGDWPEIASRGRLRVLAWADKDPEMFSFEPQSAAGPGLERELLESFCRAYKVAMEVQRVEDFTREIPMLQKDEGDIIIGIIDTAARREQVAFTQEVFPVRFFVGSHVSTPPITTVEQLREREVGVGAGSSWIAMAPKAGVPAHRLKVFAKRPLMWAALDAGRIGAVVMPAADLALAVEQRPQLREDIPLGEKMSFCWALRKDNPLLRAKLDEFLATARSGNDWSRLVVKYYGSRAVQILKRAKE